MGGELPRRSRFDLIFADHAPRIDRNAATDTGDDMDAVDHAMVDNRFDLPGRRAGPRNVGSAGAETSAMPADALVEIVAGNQRCDERHVEYVLQLRVDGILGAQRRKVCGEVVGKLLIEFV